MTTATKAPTISGPIPTEGLQEDAAYYEVTVIYQGMPLRYRLHNEWDYGIDSRGAMPDCPPRWYGTAMDAAPEYLDLPPETVEALRTIWESLFRPAPATPVDPVFVPCPLGCERQVAAEANFIHYCPLGHEYVGAYNGPPRTAPKPATRACCDCGKPFRTTTDRERCAECIRGRLDTLPAASRVNWPERPPARCPIPCEDLRQLYKQDPGIYRLRLAALSPAELAQQAKVYAAYHTFVTGKHITADETLARFRRSIAVYHAQAALTKQAEPSDDICHVLYQLALTDPAALIELLRSHTPLKRQQLAWRYAPWLAQHGINVEWTYIERNWAVLLGETGVSAAVGA